MALLNDLPTDSVLRRHAITDRNRLIGLPPTDAVLRRHHDQWMCVLLAEPLSFASMVASPAAAAAAPARTAPEAAAAPVKSPAASAPAVAAGGGFFGWLRRALGL